jgi:hypothetical protein
VVGAGGVKPSLPSPPHYESNITVEIKLKKYKILLLNCSGKKSRHSYKTKEKNKISLLYSFVCCIFHLRFAARNVHHRSCKKEGSYKVLMQGTMSIFF